MTGSRKLSRRSVSPSTDTLRYAALRMQQALLELGFDKCQLSFICGKYYLETNVLELEDDRSVCARLIASSNPNQSSVSWSQVTDPGTLYSYDLLYSRIKYVIDNGTTQGMP